MTKQKTNLPELRKKAGLSQAKLSARLEIAQTVVASWEARGSIPAVWIPKLAEILNCTADDILGMEYKQEPQEIDRRTLEGKIYELAAALELEKRKALLNVAQALTDSDRSGTC